MADRFSQYPCQVDDGSSPLTLNQISETQVSVNGSFIDLVAAGATDRTYRSLISADPVVSVKTRDLGTVLDAFSIGTAYDASSGATIQYKRRADCGTYEATNHIQLSSTLGCAYVSNISASQDDSDGAMLEFEYYPLFDGTNDPLTIATNIATASLVGTPAITAVFHMSKVIVNSVQVEGLQSISIDTGMTLDRKRADGDVWARVAPIITRQPVIQLTLNDLSEIGTINDAFLSALPGAIDCYFQEGVSGGSRVAAATGTHVKISAASGTWSPDNVSATGNEDGTMTITVAPTAVLTEVTNSAIP